jgi:hypothetical protein
MQRRQKYPPLSPAVALSSLLLGLRAPGQIYSLPQGVVPDESTAISIAKAIAIPVYGANKIDREEPLKAKLDSGIWHISGTLHCGIWLSWYKSTCADGTIEVDLTASDGRVLKLIHEK